MYRSILPEEVNIPERHQLIIGTVGPRPIAFVSTVNETGQANVAPYSFFNAFSSNPPILVFSSNRRVRGNTTKDTLHNVMATREVVINMVDYAMVRQMTLASIEYPPDVNEFDKAGLTPIPSDLVAPFRVAESPAQYECKVRDIIPLGDAGGAGHLIICEVVKMHFSEHIFDEEGKIDPQRIDLMSRMGRAFYCRAHGENVFPIIQPFDKMGVGFDNLPLRLRASTVLTGRDLAELASLEQLPEISAVEEAGKQVDAHTILANHTLEVATEKMHQLVKQLITQGQIEQALAVALVPDYLWTSKD